MKLALAIILAVAALLRVAPWWSQVMRSDGVAFLSPDAWYRMRLVDLYLSVWPMLPTSDPLMYGLSDFSYRPLLTWLVMAAGPWRDVWGAILPVLVGVGVVYVTYLLARELLLGRWALLAAAIVAIMPTELWRRSSLGYTDHHVLEVLLLSLTLLFVIRRSWRFGWTLGLYAWAWQSSGLFIAAILVGVMFQYSDDWRKSGLLVAGGLILLMALFPQDNQRVATFALGLSTIGLAFALREKPLTRGVLVGAVVVGMLIAQLGEVGQQVGETPLTENAHTDWLRLGYQYGLFLFPFVVGVARLLDMERQRRVVESLTAYRNWILGAFGLLTFLTAVWSVRWGYYAAVPFGIIAAYGLKHIVRREATRRFAVTVVACCGVILAAHGYIGWQLASSPNWFTPEWRQALAWLRGNTPAGNYTVMSTPNWGAIIMRVGERRAVAWGYNPGAMAFYRGGDAAAIRDNYSRYVLVHRGDVDYQGRIHPFAGQYIVSLWEERASGVTRVYASENIKIWEVDSYGSP